jgi:hypothetical protein
MSYVKPELKFEIERGIPVPEFSERGKWGFCADLQVGDSIFISEDHPEYATITYGMTNWGQRQHPKVSFRSLREKGGRRIWRVK